MNTVTPLPRAGRAAFPRTSSGLLRKFSVAALVAALIVALSACETTNPFTGEREINKTSKGAGIGAAGGAVAGAIISGSRKSVLLGAGIGLLVGAAVGHYMDREEEKLRQQLQGTGVSVTRQGDLIILNMPGNVTFATDSAAISADFYEVLNSVALVVNEFEQTYVAVIGHTDSTGRREYNMRLSEKRAESVARYLIAQKVLTERVLTQGKGPDYPVASNATPEGRAQNRRVEIHLTPLT